MSNTHLLRHNNYDALSGRGITSRLPPDVKPRLAEENVPLPLRPLG